jgi:hypothetical protein
MPNSGKCPHCKASVSEVKIENVVINGGEEKYRGVSYLCAACLAVLCISFDPLTLKAETVAEVADILRED